MLKKSVLFSFETVRVAVEAFQYSFPIIFLDSCFLKHPGPSTQLMSASFKTTENHLLPICFGTAPAESNLSWNFFLCNLRQVLTEFCPQIHDFRNIILMSDRNKGLLNAVPTQFPESLHHYCAMHLLGNIKGNVKECYFWKAVDATDARILHHCCSNAGLDMTSLKNIYKHWVLFGIIEDGRKRYKIRTNNGAESLNNAFKPYRSISPLNAMHQLHVYATRKFQEYCSLTRTSQRDPTWPFTQYAQTVYDSNRWMANNCKVVSSSSTEWKVQEFNHNFSVKLSSSGELSCSCLRYDDEEIPCQHILKVLSDTGRTVDLRKLIGPIHLWENYLHAFPEKPVFVPKDCALYLSNPLVVTPESEKKDWSNKNSAFLWSDRL